MSVQPLRRTAVLGAGTIHGLYAQGTPPIYVVGEIEVSNVEAYTRDYVPRAQALIKSMGGRFLAAGQKVTALEGDPPKTRVAVQVWPSMDKVQAWQKSAELKELRTIAKDYAKFRVFAVEGLPQYHRRVHRSARLAILFTGISSKFGDDEGHALGHQACHEGNVARQSVQLGNQDATFGRLRGSEGCGKLRTAVERVCSLAGFGFDVLGDVPVAKPADVPGVAITRDNTETPRNVTLLLGLAPEILASPMN